MSYPQGYLYQPPGSLALYSCPAYGASALAAPRSEELARSSSGSAFSPYPGSAAFTAQAAATGFSSPLQYSTDPATGFPSYMGSPYEAHPTGMSGAISYHPYGSPAYPYQLNDPAYRKNATRDATATLKAWLQEHRKNPYPTKGEKIMLAIITKMTLTQVSTWFANARRRLKKENKMTWPPRNKCADEKRPDEDEDDGEGQGESLKKEKLDEPSSKEEKELGLSDLEDYDPLESESSEGELKAPAFGPVEGEVCGKEPPLGAPLEGSLERAKSCLKDQEGCEAKPWQHHQQQQLLEGGSKPRIWSLAHTATSLNQAEYPSCMLKRPQGGASAPGPPATPAVSVIERPPKDSPVTNLRNWVDGVFHDPLFRHSTLNQALSNTTVSWATTKGSILETTGALGRSLAAKGQLDSGKDFLAFPKAGSKMFCS